MGGSPSSQPTPSPEESAKAQAMSQLAGTMFDIGTKPTQAYAEALDQLQFNPIFSRISNADQANSALRSAQMNQAVSATANPYGTSALSGLNRTSANRLASVTGAPMAPGLTTMNTKGVYDYPKMSDLPGLDTVAGEAKSIA